MGGYAQVIDINDAGDPQSSFGPEQLIDEVLINSVCSSVRDFTFQVYGTPTETEKKSYGYFKRGAALDFPFVEGIVIASGKVFEGGNRDNDATLGNFNAGIDNVGLPGDTDLNTAMQCLDVIAIWGVREWLTAHCRSWPISQAGSLLKHLKPHSAVQCSGEKPNKCNLGWW